jgi:hypothetical protein
MKSSVFAGLVLGLAVFSYAPTAEASSKCEKVEESKKEKCEADRKKSLEKLRKATKPMKPSDMGAAFAALDDDAKNPFAMDDFYVGKFDTGVKPFDELGAAVAKVQGTVVMASYVGHLAASGKADEARVYGAALLPLFKSIDDDVKAVKAKVDAVVADPKSLVMDNPLKAPKIIAAAPTLLTMVTDTITAIPGAKGAIGAIASGAAAGAVKDAVGGATGK